MVTVAGKLLSTRAIHRIITEGLLLAGVKKPGIVVHSLRHSTPTFALLNNANPTRVQKMMRHQHYATTEIYVEEVQKLLEGAEEAVTQIEAARCTTHASHHRSRDPGLVRCIFGSMWLRGEDRQPQFVAGAFDRDIEGCLLLKKCNLFR